MNKKYNQKDWDLWKQKYVEENKTLQEISNELNVNVHTISKKLNELGVMRSNDIGVFGRKPWNKGLKGEQDAWNKGMKGTYPYPSGFKGHKSPLKGIPRSKEIRDKIAFALRLTDYNGFCTYKNRLKEQDTLYLVTLKDKKGLLYKIGRTFETVERRHGSNLITIHKTWKTFHEIVAKIELEVLKKFKTYSSIGESVSGRTECFSTDLPINEVINFIDMAISSQAEGTPSEGSETTGEL
jgi:hypothetical protein